jgi:bis(5'-adenosyl)-triphosphatase
MEETCPFCQPDIREITFLESANFRAICNRAPILPGHSLLIPIRHLARLEDLPAEWGQEFFDLSIEATRLLKKAFKADGINWTIQDGFSAGQTVNHLHLHLIPRHQGDFPDPGDWYPAFQKSEQENIDSNLRPIHQLQELKHIASYLRSQVKI